MSMDDSPLVRTVHLDGDNTNLANFCGPLDENLRQIANAFNVSLKRRGDHITIKGPDANITADTVQWFYNRAVHMALSIDDVQLGLVEIKARHDAQQKNWLLHTLAQPPHVTKPLPKSPYSTRANLNFVLGNGIYVLAPNVNASIYIKYSIMTSALAWVLLAQEKRF